MSAQVSDVVREAAVSVETETTAADAIAAVQGYTPAPDGVAVYYVYVTEDEKLVGVVSMRELVNAKNDVPVSEIMTTDLVSVLVSDSLQHTIRRVIDERFAVLPVVDEHERFLGVIRASDVIDAMDEQATKQLFEQAGFWFG